MSIDNPNEYEKAIEDYAQAVREEKKAILDLAHATRRFEDTRNARQVQWHAVRAFVNQSKILQGVYRLRKFNDMVEGILIEQGKDYPEVFPMYR